MRMLALEAGGPVASAALFDGATQAASHWVAAPRQQTEALAPLVRALLAQAAWPADSLQAVACGAGPGSFSGLRSSLAFGTGLALAKPGLQLLAVSTLQAWAEAYGPRQARVRVLLDGRRGQAYGALYERGAAAWQALEEPALRDLAEWRQAYGSEALISDLEEGLLGRAPLPLPGPSAALAEAVGRLAQGPAPALAWEPIYLRRSEAEILWDKLHGAQPKREGRH